MTYPKIELKEQDIVVDMEHDIEETLLNIGTVVIQPTYDDPQWGTDIKKKILQSLEENKNFEQIIELFVEWNERRLMDREFAEKIVNLLGEKYYEASRRLSEENTK